MHAPQALDLQGQQPSTAQGALPASGAEGVAAAAERAAMAHDSMQAWLLIWPLLLVKS